MKALVFLALFVHAWTSAPVVHWETDSVDYAWVSPLDRQTAISSEMYVPSNNVVTGDVRSSLLLLTL